MRTQRPPGERRGVEIQVHPGDIRRRVRYIYFTPKEIAGWVAAMLVYLAFLATAAYLTPSVIRGYVAHQQQDSLVAERELQGKRLEALVERLEELESQGETLRLRVSKVFLAYGLSIDDSQGQGGFPFEARPVPKSVYSNVIQHGVELDARLTEQSRVLETFLDEVRSFEEAHAERARTTPSISPIRSIDEFVLTSPFGRRRNPFTKKLDFHAGIDLAAGVGTEIRASAEGYVVFAGRVSQRRSVGWWRYGNLVAVRNGDEFITLYGHCNEVKVRRGQKVEQGDVIATVGNTGWSTSPHLHYEVRRRDQDGEFRPVDPRIYILDHRWRDEERLLVQARSAPDLSGFEPLPRLLQR